MEKVTMSHVLSSQIAIHNQCKFVELDLTTVSHFQSFTKANDRSQYVSEEVALISNIKKFECGETGAIIKVLASRNFRTIN